MATAPVLIVCQGSTTDSLAVDTFNLADGSFLASYTYAIGTGTQSIQDPYQCVNDTIVMSNSLATGVVFSSALALTGTHVFTAPISGGTAAPQCYPNIPSAATRVIGLWQKFAGPPYAVTVEDINPITLAQAPLWDDFQPDLTAGIAGRGLSRNGNLFYYTQAGPIFALNLTTGISTTFIALLTGADTVSNSGTFGIYELPDGTFLVLWHMIDTTFRLVQYSAAGTPAGIDLNLGSTFVATIAFAPESDGSAVWIVGQAGAPDFLQTFQRYTIPGEVLDVDTTYGDDTLVYGDLLIGELPSLQLTGLHANCDQDPVTITITGTNISLMAVADDLTGPSGAVTFTIQTQSTTEIVLANLSPAFEAGEWCVTVTNPGEDPIELCNTIACEIPPPNPGTPRLIRRQRVFPLAYLMNLRSTISRLEIVPQPGVGTTGQGATPMLRLEISKDGGNSYSPEIEMTVGAVGEYTRRWYTNRLGQGRNWVARVTATDPVFFALIECTIEGKPGLS